MNIVLPSVEHNRAGFEHLAQFYAQVQNTFFDSIEVNLSDWFDADMCAPLGALLYHLGTQANSVQVRARRADNILTKNGFLSHYGRQRVQDTWGTTIPYLRFDVTDDRYFSRYIETSLISRQEIPEMSSRLIKRFRESVFELFDNAVLHSQTQGGIFSCGQFFPKRQRINFAIADLGIGIKRNIQQHLGLNMVADQAIHWATERRNTTKRAAIPGGLGLKLLREFIGMNGGCIQIVSDNGYWQQNGTQVTMALLSHPFPGTVVTLEIDTADTKTYTLAANLSPADIF